MCQGCRQVSLHRHSAALGPCHRDTGRKRAPLVPAKAGKGGEHGRAPALSPLGEWDRLGLTAQKGAEQLGINSGLSHQHICVQEQNPPGTEQPGRGTDKEQENGEKQK